LLQESLISNHYPGWLIDQTFSKRRKKFPEFTNIILEKTETKDVFCSSPYVPVLSENLKRILEQQSGVYKIPNGCESSYVGHTNQNLKMRLLQHHKSISSSLKQNSKPEDFMSVLSKIQNSTFL